MKNYLKSTFKKVENFYSYYKSLSYYTQKRGKYKFINFLCLVKYIIFEEISYLLKLRPRVMNQLEALELIEEAKAYANRNIQIWITIGWNSSDKSLVTTKFVDVASISTQVNNEKINVDVYAKLVDLEIKDKYYTPSLKSVIDEFKRVDNLLKSVEEK